jgi:hypothetical protein
MSKHRYLALTDRMTMPRVFHVAAMVNTGKYLVEGGVGTNTAELYDSATEKFTATGSMVSGHTLSTATLLPSGQVMIIAGQNTGSFILMRSTCTPQPPARSL